MTNNYKELKIALLKMENVEAVHKIGKNIIRITPVQNKSFRMVLEIFDNYESLQHEWFYNENSIFTINNTKLKIKNVEHYNTHIYYADFKIM